MKWIQARDASDDSYIQVFLDNLIEELQDADNFLSPDEAKHLRNYYGFFYRNNITPAEMERSILGLSRGDFNYVISRILSHKGGKPLRILDAGSGTGTHSIFFGLMGAEVLGIDLREERHLLASKRRIYYEKKLGLNLLVDFKLVNIFNLDRNEFDLIWVNNAISHIHPIDDFLKFCNRLLKVGGEIVILDANKMFLPKNVMLYRERGNNLYTTVKDPNTGEDVIYAVERILSLPNQCSLLRKYGFQIVSRECFIGFHTRVSKFIYENLIRPVNRSMFLSSILGKRYIVVGRKYRDS